MNRYGMVLISAVLVVGCGLDHDAFMGRPDGAVNPAIGDMCTSGVVRGCNSNCANSYYACIGGHWDCIYDPMCPPPSTAPADSGMITDASVATDTPPAPADVLMCADRRAGQVCTNGVGQCARMGHFVCTSGGGAQCDAVLGIATAEVCDGIDNDCNNIVDEMAPLSCYDGPMRTIGVGACHAGTRMCRGREGWSMACNGEVLPTAEIPGNAIDEDCDGYAAPALGGTCAGSMLLGMPCERGLGLCRVASRWACIDGTRVECPVAPPPPRPEFCDGLDNDCDGEIDNNCGPGRDAGARD